MAIKPAAVRMPPPAGCQCPLTRGQLEILQLAAQGLDYQQIAAERNTAVSTVRSHLHFVYERLGVHTVGQAVIRCYREGWLLDAQDSKQAVRWLANETSRLIQMIERHDGITVPQRDYLAAFREMLFARDDDAKITARFHMDQALDGVSQAQNINLPQRPKRDLVELLARVVEIRRARPR